MSYFSGTKILSTDEGYNKKVVVSRLEAATENFGRRRVWYHTRTGRTGNVPQSTSAVKGAGQQTIVQQ